MAVHVPTRAELGRTIRALRQERRLSIERLAELSSMHPTYLSGIERGLYNPSWDKLAALARAFAVPVSDIVRQAEGRE